MSIIEKALEKTTLGKTTARIENAGSDAEIGVSASVDSSANPPPNGVPLDNRPLGDRDIEIDFRILEEKGMLIPDSPHSQIGEEYRIIKRPLIINAFGKSSQEITNSNLILVSSSLPGEGKTFTAVNLAMSIATERDKTVLLVDADVEKPTISQLFNVRGETGLTDLLVDSNTSFSDTVIRTNIPNLSLMPAGKRHKHSTELLASDKMARLTSEMSRRYSDRIIIFDSPPLMVATQGSVLANHVGQVVMVIETDKTPQYIVKEAVRKLSGCDVVACVLNKTKKRFGFNYYAYYGYYGRS